MTFVSESFPSFVRSSGASTGMDAARRRTAGARCASQSRQNNFVEGRYRAGRFKSKLKNKAVAFKRLHSYVLQRIPCVYLAAAWVFSTFLTIFCSSIRNARTILRGEGRRGGWEVRRRRRN